MGYAQSWLAVRGRSREAVLEALGLRATGEREEVAESPLAGAALPGGWYAVIANASGHALMRGDVLARLSQGAEVVSVDVEEHVMVSQAEGWRDGVRFWSVMHDGQQGTDHLENSGTLPEGFAAVRDRLAAQQREAGGASADVDYLFDAPVELARGITGYRHDEDIPGHAAEPFEVLTQTDVAAPRSFWKRLLGG